MKKSFADEMKEWKKPVEHRWQSKESFIKWVEGKKAKALHDFRTSMMKASPENDILRPDSKDGIDSLNANVNIELFKDMVDEGVLKHFNKIMKDKDIELIHLHLFLSTVESVDFFNSSDMLMLKSKNSNYDKSIAKLKKTADELQYYSPAPIKIRIPTEPQTSIYKLRRHLEKYKVNEKIAISLYSYFGDTKKQKPTKGYRDRKEKLNTLLSATSEISVFEEVSDIRNSMHYYTAKKKS